MSLPERHLVQRWETFCPKFPPSPDDQPYFQCFFVDEDEAQFPFYAFSPLQIWHLSLNNVFFLFYIFILRVTRSSCCCHAADCQDPRWETLNSRGRRVIFKWWTDFNFGWAPNTCSRFHSFTFCVWFFHLCLTSLHSWRHQILRMGHSYAQNSVENSAAVCQASPAHSKHGYATVRRRIEWVMWSTMQ